MYQVTMFLSACLGTNTSYFIDSSIEGIYLFFSEGVENLEFGEIFGIYSGSYDVRYWFTLFAIYHLCFVI